MRQRLARRPRGDDGLSLIEVMVALFALTLVSIAAASFFISGVRTTAAQSQQQTASALATQALEAVQSVPVSQVLLGRSRAAVDALLTPQMKALLNQDVTALEDSTGAPTNYDPSAATAGGQVVPVTRTQQVEGTVFTVSTAIDRCWLSRSGHTCGPLAPTSGGPSDAVAVLRASVYLTWGASSCGTCHYTASVLLDRQDDPLFRLATSVPVIVTMVPSDGVRGTSVPVTLTGKDFAGGTLITLPTGGGTVTGITRSPDGKKVTGTWLVGTTPGPYTLALTNPDTGRAEYSPAVVRPVAVADCAVVSSNGATTLLVRSNDGPALSGTVQLLSGSAFGVNGGASALTFNPPNGTAADYTATYTLTVSGAVSDPATVVVHYKQGTC